jgi:transposase
MLQKQYKGAVRHEAPSKSQRRSPLRADAALRQQLKEQQARGYITDQCHENPDITCQELREGLKSRNIRMSPRRVNSLRRALGLKRPSGSRAAHLRSSSVHPQARAWLVQERTLNPDMRVSTLQAGLREIFQINIGTRQLNNVLRELGVSRPGPHRLKTEASQ